MNYKRKKRSEPREFACNWRMDGLLKKEEADKVAAFTDKPCQPKPKKNYKKIKGIKNPIKKKVQCRQCGFYIGFVEVEDNSWRTWLKALTKKFGDWWTLCDSCKRKRNAS